VAVPQNKIELLSAIDKNFNELLKELKAVPWAIVDECSMKGHAKDTQMSVANLAAYLIGWNELVLKWLGKSGTEEPIDFPETGFNWNELDRLAQKFYRDYETVSYPQLLDRLETVKCRIVSEIKARKDDELYGRPWYRKWTMGRMIQFNTSSPYANARRRVRKWMKARDA